MWSSDRRLVLVALAALAGCGFRPVYGPGGAAEGMRGTIEVAAPDDKHGYELVARLESRLGRGTGGPYLLSYTIDTREVGAGITRRQETTRYNVVGSVDFRLTERAGGKVAASGRVSSFTSYTSSASPVATLSASEDAYRRLMTILADQIVTRLEATAGSWR